MFRKLKKFIAYFMHFIWTIRYRLIYLLHGKVVGARALVVRNEQVLLIRHSYGTGWYTIGGEVDKGELPLDAIKREIYEEAGIKATTDPELIGVYHSSIGKRDDFVFFYIVHDFSQEKSSSPEIEECRWFSFDALPKDIIPATKRRIDEYLKKIQMTDTW